MKFKSFFYHADGEKKVNTLMAFPLLLLAIMLTLTTSCKKKDSNDDRIKIALQTSGQNAFQLQNVIDHYKVNPSDSFKLRAAYFLIGNMLRKGWWKYSEVNGNGPCSYNFFNRGMGVDSILYFKKKYYNIIRN